MESRAGTVGNGEKACEPRLVDLARRRAGHQADPLSTGTPEVRQRFPVEDSSEPIRREQCLSEAPRHLAVSARAATRAQKDV